MKPPKEEGSRRRVVTLRVVDSYRGSSPNFSPVKDFLNEEEDQTVSTEKTQDPVSLFR